MPFKPDEPTWAALLSACKQYENAKMAIKFADHLLSLKPEEPSTYIKLSNVYASSGVWEHASKARHLLETLEVRKEPGYSYVYFGKESQTEKTIFSTWKFDKDAIKKALIHMIVVDELPFRIVKGEGFKQFLSIACPRFHLPSRFTVRRDCLDLFNSMKKSLKNSFEQGTSKVCLTTDTWTSLQRVSYMVLIAHWIDDEWKLQKRIINFCPISAHRGESLGQALESAFGIGGSKEFSLLQLTMHLLMDKCNKYLGDATNMNFMVYLAIILDPQRKMGFVDFGVQQLFPDVASEVMKMVERGLHCLFDEYSSIFGRVQDWLRKSKESINLDGYVAEVQDMKDDNVLF
ncbi:hypothetical protein V6N13_138386 [Hibiscus sabdariffa]